MVRRAVGVMLWSNQVNPSNPNAVDWEGQPDGTVTGGRAGRPQGTNAPSASVAFPTVREIDLY
jgi:hypothetical protein